METISPVKESPYVSILDETNQEITDKGLFSDLKIFVEIFNNNINQSDCVIPILKENGAEVQSKITKSTDLIIFKDGRKKVIQKALDNSIKVNCIIILAY
jgi:hypothetical protein